MKRFNYSYETNETYEEINTLCRDDDYSVFTWEYTKSYRKESGYDTYTGCSDDSYYDW